MKNIDFDAMKASIKQNHRPMLSGITVGGDVVYRLHESKTKKKKKRKARRRRSNYRGYLGAWCPWWVPYNTCHGQHDPKFDPAPPPPTQEVPDSGSAPIAPVGPSVGGGDVGGVAAGGAVGESVDGVVIGESASNGLFFEDVNEAVGFLVSSELVEVSPKAASDTLRMLRNGVADAISCYTPQLPKRHPFKVFKVSDVPTEKIREWGYVCEAVDGDVSANPNFVKWFGSSKVVDGVGKPLVVWHGTHSEFEVFDPQVGSVPNPVATGEVRNGLFFTDNYEMAKSFSGGNAPMSCYLRMESPLVVNAHGEDWMSPLFKLVDADGNEVRFEGRYATGMKWIRRHPDLPEDIMTAVSDFSTADMLNSPGEFSYDLIPALVNATSLRFKYDGVIIRDVLEGDDAGVYGKDELPDDAECWSCTDYVVFDPRQVKSVDNSGKFSRREKNIHK